MLISRERPVIQILTLITNRTWKLVELSPEAQVVNLSWIFKLKLNPDNTTECY